MSGRTLLTLLTCVSLGIIVPGRAFAQPGSTPVNAGASSGGADRGGGRGSGRGPLVQGPPAPVPPEVAMARPTPAEIDRMNAGLKRFIETSPDKELFEKYESLVTLQMPRENTAVRPSGNPRNSQHQAFVNTAATGDFDILFLGDSITYLWTVGDGDISGYPGGKTVFDKHFADLKIANFGIPGDTTQGLLWRLQNGEGQGRKPKALMLMIGTNNNGNSAEEIAEGVGAVVLELRKDFPDARILLMAIFPRGTGPGDAGRRRVEAANNIIARLHDGNHVVFMNINDKFTDSSGGLIGFRPSDHLHPVPEGYEIWASAVAPTLKRWVE